MYYINVIYSIQVYVYYKALCQAWLLKKVEIIGTKWQNDKRLSVRLAKTQPTKARI